MTARQAALVHTTETTRIRFFMDMLVQLKRPVMLIGNAGLGKTVIINDKLASLGEDYAVSNVPFNFYTTSEMLQRVRVYARPDDLVSKSERIPVLILVS